MNDGRARATASQAIVVLLAAAAATAQVEVYGVRGGGEWVRLDLTTGVAYPIVGSGMHPVLNVADFVCFLQEFAVGCP